MESIEVSGNLILSTSGEGDIQLAYTDTNNTNSKLILLISEDGDWEAMYINNEKDDEGHKLDSEYWFRLGQRFQNIEWSDITVYRVDGERAEEDGVEPFPDDFNDLLEKYYER